MADTPEHLAERLKVEGEKTLHFFHGLSPEQWERRVYTEGSCWTIRQVLAHFTVSEASFARLIGDILAGGQGAPENFQIDYFNERTVGKLEAATPIELLEKYVDLRSRFTALVQGLHPDDLLKTGRHPYLGVATIEDIIKLLYRHNAIHIREIRRIIA